jgi:hypothetical protein
MLKIPVSAICINPTYVDIFSDGILIGGIPYIKTVGDVNIYDTDDRNLYKLKWNIIYEKHKEELRMLLEESLDSSDLEIIVATFRRLYVKDLKDKLIGYFECIYKNGNWIVVSLDFH